MKFFFTNTLIIFNCFLIFSQHLFYEQNNDSNESFGSLDAFSIETNYLTPNFYQITAFDKTEGWDLVAADYGKYYYQITDSSSANYGQIDYWDSENNIRVSYGNLGDIFDDPLNWTLGGVDQGIMYFGSSANNSQIVSWDGSEIESFAYLRDFLAVPANWRFAGFYKGEMYVEWKLESDFWVSVRKYDGESITGGYDDTDFYTNYDDAFLFGVSEKNIISDVEIDNIFNSLTNHINGLNPLSSAQLIEINTLINENILMFSANDDAIGNAFELVDLYDNTFGALFTNESFTYGGFPNDSIVGYELENCIISIIQGVIDYSYTQENLENFSTVFSNRYFQTSSYFPGSVTQPEDSEVNYDVQINASHIAVSGTPANYLDKDARRPTGCYLAPGSIVQVTVPSNLVGIGASILVGSHTWDMSEKPTMKRMDRVTVSYPINSEVVTIGNPLGGGIYINIPYLTDLGVIDINIKNAVKSPYFSNTVANETTLEEWQAELRNYDVPWADFETEKVMINVPTSWVYAQDDPKSLLDDWDLSMDAISEMLGRPLIRPKTILYFQVDIQARGSANYPGYPMTNIGYDPYYDYGGNHNHYIVQGPENKRGANINTLFHELGHAEKIYKYRGEIEAFVNLLWVAVYNKKFGIELNTAFAESFWYNNHDVNQAAQSWMISPNFREGNQMQFDSGALNEFNYQQRGYAKYIDIIRLFDWNAIEDLYSGINDSYDNGTYEYSGNVNYVPADSHTLRLSKATGYDMRPLMHFWGIHPDDFELSEQYVTDNNLKQSTAIYDVLQYYKTIVLSDNSSFKEFGLNDYTEESILSYVNPNDYSPLWYNQGFLSSWWDIYDETHAAQTLTVLQDIIDLYFPEGRPETDNSSCYEIDILSAEASSYESDSTNDAGNAIDGDASTRWAALGDGEYIIFDLGEEYSICDMQLDFYENVSRSYTFDVEVSRDNLTYAPVFQSITNTTTTDLFDDFVLSRSARYVKITGHGNSENDLNAIEEFKLYTTEKTLSNTLVNHIEREKVVVFPIPTSDILSISGLESNEASFKIYNLSGSMVYSVTSDVNKIDTSSLSDGVYFLKIYSGGGKVVVKKFVIKKQKD